MPPPAQVTTFRNFDVRADTVLIALEPGVSIGSLNALLKGLAHVVPDHGHGPLRLVLNPGSDLGEALELLSQAPGVRWAQPDYVVRTFDDEDGGDGGDPVEPPGGDEDRTLSPITTPEVSGLETSNDPGFTGGQTWGLYGDATSKVNLFGSQAGEAWAGGYVGSTKVAVGLVDSGLDYTHADLYLNVWLNPNEIPAALKATLTDTDGDGRIGFRDLNAAGNAAHVSDLNANGRIDAGDLLADARWEDGLDQDGNGYVDDLIGWDFLNDDNDPFDDTGHGTHVGGTIAALGGNAAGAAGVTWSTQLIVAKFLGPDGGFTSDAIAALDYITALAGAPGGGDIVATNNSWGGGSLSPLLEAAIVAGAQADLLFITAAGNGGADSVGDNNDAVANYPSNYSTVAGAGYEAVVAVASLTSAGGLSSFSNYGAVSVDLGAPGSSVYSTVPGGGYGSKNGTSMATAFVTGAVAMYAAVDPGASAAQIRADLLGSVTPTASLAGKSATGGRLDVSGLIYSISPSGVAVAGTGGADTFSMTAAPAGAARASVFNDTIAAGGGNDKLDGGWGVDRLEGGLGNDTFTVDSAGDVVVEAAGEGVDLVNSPVTLTLPANVEKLTLTGAAAVSGAGNALDNTLTGNNAANQLDGLDGADTITGGAGADTLMGGQGADRLTGGTGDDSLLGGDGADRLTGSAGADSMAGGADNDTYYVDDPGDAAVEVAGEGSDLVSSTISFALGDHVEKLTLTGTAAINATGNALGNVLTGNAGANRLLGLDGADTLSGGSGASGDDTLDGGAGADRLTGGAGADRFVFLKGQAAGDSVIDFAAGDRLEFSGWGAGSTLAKVAGSTTNWVITDGVTGATEVITLSNKYALTAGDWVFS